MRWLQIYCTGCQKDVQARLTNGAERYPHRPDLADLPFWKCDTCGNYVGCHHKTKTPTRPLGVIATPEILDYRKRIHAVIDPLWKDGHIARGKLYSLISKELGHQYHTGEIRTVAEAQKIYHIVLGLT